MFVEHELSLEWVDVLSAVKGDDVGSVAGHALSKVIHVLHFKL
jgi:hypothetical protein